jgi:hypothetical protein
MAWQLGNFGVPLSDRDDRRRYLGVVAVCCLFKIEVELTGQGVGLVAAGFLLLFMPLGPYLRCGSTREFWTWIEVLAPGRDR